MKKLLSFFLLLLCLGTGKAWAETLTVNATNGAFTRADAGSGSYKDVWTSTSGTPLLTVKCASSGRINVQSDCVDYYSGTYTITIDASSTLTLKPEYVITGYSITATSTSEEKITPAGGSETVFSTSEATTLNVTGLNTTTTTFVLANGSQSNKPLKVTSFTVTYEPATEVATGLYRIKSTWQNWLYTDAENPNDLYKKKSGESVSTYTLLTDANYIFEVKKQGDKVTYLKSASTGHYAVLPQSNNVNSGTVMNTADEASAESFTIVSRESNVTGAVALQSTGYSGTAFLNVYSSGNNNVGWFNTAHEGDRLLFTPVKTVTFTEAVAVDGGEAITTIYVAQDGSDSFTLQDDKLYSIGGGANMGCADAAAAIAAAGTENITVTVSNNDTKTVTYKLSWGGSIINTVNDITVYSGSPASTYVPSAFVSDLTTLAYSPETIDNTTAEVTVTATWNGYPFQLSESFADAKWYTVGIHTAHESNNHIWQYNSSGSTLSAVSVATNACLNLTDDNCFCFVGNPYTGITIYNKSAGDGMSVQKANDNSQTRMAAEGTKFIPKASSETGKTFDAGYTCFLVNGGTFYINCYDSDNYNLKGWSANNNGSTCWFIPAGQYYLNNIDGYNPGVLHGAVGTYSYFESHPEAETNIQTLRSAIESDLYRDVTTINALENISLLTTLSSETPITLGEGYYRIVNAYTGFATKPAMYYDSSSDNIKWSQSALSDASYRVNSIFKFSAANDGKYNIYAPNAAKSITAVTGALDATAADIAVTSLGSAQYKFTIDNGNPMHAQGWNWANNNEGSIVAWAGEADTPSAWYIVQVNDIDINLNNGGDGSFYATLCLPFDVTLNGANAYTLTLNDAKTALNLSEAITEIPAGTPVLLKGDAATATATIASSASCVAAPLTSTGLTGTYNDLTVVTNTDYFLGKSDNIVGFYKWTGTTLKANRAYLPASTVDTNEVKGFALNSDTEVGIETLVTEEAKDSKGIVYNLAGQRVAQPTRGIYVVGGRKVVIK